VRYPSPLPSPPARSASPGLTTSSPLKRAGALWGLCLLLLVAWALHWRTFGVEELGQDGALSVDLGLGSLGAMFVYSARDVHPPLFFALLHAMFAVGGTGYLVAKFLPIAAAQLTLVILYRLVRTLAGPLAAWCATGLLLLSAPFLLLSPTVRPFTLGLCCSLLSLLLTVRCLLIPGGNGRRHVALALVTMGALLSWYLQLFFLALELWLFCWPARGPGSGGVRAAPGAVRRAGLAALATGTALALPWYAFVLPALLAKIGRGETVTEGTPAWPTISGVLAGLEQALAGSTRGWLPLVALAGGALALLVGIVRLACETTRGSPKSPDHRLAQRLLLPGLALGALEVALILARWQHPDAAGRYILALLPFVVALQALALAQPSGWWRWPARLGVLLAMAGQLAWFGGLLAVPPHDYEHDGESTFLLTHLRTSDAVLFSDHGRRGQFLLNRRFSGAYLTAVVQTSGDRYLGDSATQAGEQVASLAVRAPRIWYVNTEERPGRPRLGQQALAARAYVVSQSHAGDSDISLFLTQPPDVRRTLNVNLGGVVTLLTAYFSDRPTGGGVSVRLIWRDDRPQLPPYSVFVHLDTAGGRLVAQQDGVPAAGLLSTEHWQPSMLIDDRRGLIVPSGVAAGSYVLHVGMYRVGGARLALPDGSNQVEVGTVRVGG
jgi:hypothetical protein